ncbi:MAG: ubiquinol-cytochrome c reductase iron-sulfur subunit [Pseudomonadota bacterium]|nr:ubiquinol-cytochrome c reductase iron-sulfur subunit [Hyphomicrobiales bacterium]MBS70451.1 ubiquinol-cytochrome c reductase iron-sulfur subunit [Rhodobiaceae bacterium]MEC7087959.1 ubiquinol-cytochrome c reductase iron-sulfur subunit [Pseudomonadota bacterium]MEC7670820.1 ubiquinol-cytochrome c reductase iron-sulfur subunit [Pseudomonadota bacterium]MEC7927782.1 ubiquinol-cytochrome c reductase iron-sulfur subunit [Pseudomonadota bacterium]
MSDKDPKQPSRRDFIFLATGAFAAVGAASIAWPIVDQMNPDATALALSKIEVDISQLERGQAITVKWRGKPVFIRRRTEEEIQMASRVDIDSLPDNNARNYNLSPDSAASDENRSLDENGEWLVMVGVCTHLGCVPKGQSLGDSKGDFGGWYCPCHGSHYDTAGRIRKGPAAKNLDIPAAEFINQNVIRIG